MRVNKGMRFIRNAHRPPKDRIYLEVTKGTDDALGVVCLKVIDKDGTRTGVKEQLPLAVATPWQWTDADVRARRAPKQ